VPAGRALIGVDSRFILSAGIALPAVLLAVALDSRTRRIPNALTLPLLAAGLLLHFPSVAEVWAASALVLAAWRGGLCGGGDAKLWLALFWLTPPPAAPGSLAAFALSLLSSALGQRLVLGLMKRKARVGPAAWRALPYAAWLLLPYVARF
jgi:hypothetical protein